MSDFTKEQKKKLNKLALDTFRGEVFYSQQIEDKSLINVVFAALQFLNEEQAALLSVRIDSGDVAVFYEYYSYSGSISVIGYPMFFSHKTLNRDELIYVFDRLKALAESTEKILEV